MHCFYLFVFIISFFIFSFFFLSRQIKKIIYKTYGFYIGIVPSKFMLINFMNNTLFMEINFIYFVYLIFFSIWKRTVFLKSYTSRKKCVIFLSKKYAICWSNWLRSCWFMVKVKPQWLHMTTFRLSLTNSIQLKFRFWPNLSK